MINILIKPNHLYSLDGLNYFKDFMNFYDFKEWVPSWIILIDGPSMIKGFRLFKL